MCQSMEIRIKKPDYFLRSYEIFSVGAGGPPVIVLICFYQVVSAIRPDYGNNSYRKSVVLRDDQHGIAIAEEPVIA